jgi:hypothetical protein
MVVALIISIGAVPATAIVELDPAQETVDEPFRI